MSARGLAVHTDRVRRAGDRAGVAGNPECPRLAGIPVAAGVRWYRLVAAATLYLREGMCAGGCAGPARVGPEAARFGVVYLRHAGPTSAISAENPHRRTQLEPGFLGSGVWIRPRQPAHSSHP